MMVQVPVPTTGALPSRVVGPQTVLSGPALAGVGGGVMVITTSSDTEAQDAVASVVSVSVTVPASMSSVPGTYSAVSEVMLWTMPSPAVDQLAPVALRSIVPG